MQSTSLLTAASLVQSTSSSPETKELSIGVARSTDTSRRVSVVDHVETKWSLELQTALQNELVARVESLKTRIHMHVAGNSM